LAQDVVTETIRVHYNFELDEDHSGGPSGPSYLVAAMKPRESDLKNPILRNLYLTIFFKESTTSETAEQITKLLDDYVGWVQFILPKK
jgi:hypothetical protein